MCKVNYWLIEILDIKILWLCYEDVVVSVPHGCGWHLLTVLPVYPSWTLSSKKTAQTLVIDIGSERGVQARTLQDQLYACIRIVNRFFHK